MAEDNDGAEAGASVQVDTRWVYHRPEELDDGWQTASLEDVGMDSSVLEGMVNTLYMHPGHLVEGIIIVREGKLVFEKYFPGRAHATQGAYPVMYDRDTPHILSSTTKSFTSALLGIAIDQGLIEGVNQPLSDFFPEFPWLAQGEKSSLSVEHMITMSAGLEWDQTTYPILDPRNDIHNIQAADNPWDWYLSKPLVTTPGEVFLYSEGCINVVGEVIERASGMSLDNFSGQFLFGPLGIEDFSWARVWGHPDWVWASGDLQLRPRDMAKFGKLYLQGGIWEGNRIVSQGWIEASSSPYHVFDGSEIESYWNDRNGAVGYGFAWWLKSDDYGPGAYDAWGWGDQHVTVLPAHDIVVAHTGGSYFEVPFLLSHDVITQYVIQSIR